MTDWQFKPFVIVPDLCVEIVSANDNYQDVDAKVDRYLSDGVKLVWVMRNQSVAVFSRLTLTGGDCYRASPCSCELFSPINSFFQAISYKFARGLPR